MLAKQRLGLPIPFTSAGYKNAGLMQSIYDRGYSHALSAADRAYIAEFLKIYHDDSSCSELVSGSLSGSVQTMQGMQNVGQVLSFFIDRNANDDFGRTLGHGVQALASMVGPVMQARDDAQLFYDRHKCNSDVSKQFLFQMQEMIRRD